MGGLVSRIVRLSPGHWTLLVDAILNGTVRRIEFFGVDFSALDDDALLVAAGCHGLRSLMFKQSVMPRGFVIDDLIRASDAKGVLRLTIYGNNNDAPLRVSEDAVLGFFLPADAAHGGSQRSLLFDCNGITDTFALKLFEVSIYTLKLLIQLVLNV